MVSQNGVALAISVDVTNAFNAIAWNVIVEAVERISVPYYLVRVIQAYLSDTWIALRTTTGRRREGRSSEVFRRALCWGPFCGLRRTTRSFAVLCIRALVPWY
jgi:hypothetical protein